MGSEQFTTTQRRNNDPTTFALIALLLVVAALLSWGGTASPVWVLGDIAVAFIGFSMVLASVRHAASQLEAQTDTLRQANHLLEQQAAQRLRTEEQLRDQQEELITGVNTLTVASTNILAALTQVVAGASETAAAVSAAAATVEEVKQTAHLATQKARDVSANAQQAVQIATVGERAVGDAVDGMSRVREQMESIADSVVKLGEQSRTIAEIIAAVTELAERSNLLAVNASIEAALAGEQGKGFAVVAQEVKNLAGQSKQATAQVRTLLNDIQKAANIAVMVTEQGTKSADLGVKQSADAGKSIRALAKTISEAALTVGQISASSQQQLIGMDQVAAAMATIKAGSAHHVENMRRVEGTVQKLNDLGRRLQAAVKQYGPQTGALA